MQSVKLHDKEFSLYFPEEKIIQAIDDLSVKINSDFEGKNPVFLVVLNGAFMFASDLIKRFNGNCEIEFVRFSSYEGTGSSGNVRELMGLTLDIKNRHIIVLEDIIDTGLTMMVAKDRLKSLGAASVSLATLLYKPKAFKHNYYIDYIGIEIPNDFIVGYGLDYDGLGRNLTDIYKITD